MLNDPAQIERAKALAVFTYQMLAMIEAGASLNTAMRTLGKDAPAPYDEFCDYVIERWAQDKHLPFASIMDDRPQLFPEFYVKSIKCGEIAGALQESYRHLSELLGTVLRFWTVGGCPPEWVGLLVSPAAKDRSLQWSDLTAIEHKVVLLFFCKSLAIMLASGVPLVTAGATAAEFLPVKEREYLASGLMETLRPGGRLSLLLDEIGFAPPFLVSMVAIGEESQALEQILERCALVYQRQVEIGL